MGNELRELTEEEIQWYQKTCFGANCNRHLKLCDGGKLSCLFLQDRISKHLRITPEGDVVLVLGKLKVG